MNQDDRLAALRALAGDLRLFAAHCLKIKDKSGKLAPFVFNRAQEHVHELLERQLKETGKVRALILKGRQQGVSTYVAARFYHQVMLHGRNAFVVGHEDKSTTNLFDMAKRYQANNPLAPSTKASNARELIFSALDSGYKLATAGTDDVGRGNTAQLIHASEFAYWRNPQMHLAGLGNTVADIGDTEFVIESTANGIGNAFHLMWQEAEAGRGEYIAIFVPWFWSDEYRAPVHEGLDLSDADRAYQAAYGLDMEQMQWRANKIAGYGVGFEWLFDQEYPAAAAMAFKTSTLNPLINPSLVMSAVNNVYRDMHAGLLVGCDPAGDGANDPDRTAIVFRQGRMVSRVEHHTGLNTMQIAGKLAEYHQRYSPAAIFIDKGGLGAGVVDRLIELGIPAVGVLSGQAADDPKVYENKRAEMWWRMREWFEDAPNRIPNNAALISDITAPQPAVSSNGRRMLEKKEHMRKRGIRSPDYGDALALTFSFVVTVPDIDSAWRPSAGPVSRAGY